MTDLAAFLAARLAEDEQLAKDGDSACWHIDYCDDLGPPFQQRWDPARVLAEIAAKRAIIKLHVPIDTDYTDADGQEHTSWDCDICDPAGSPDMWPCATLRLLAAPYADAPDFDESWRT